ncbi:MAG: polyphosphate kinase 2 [Gammaproteobacteria bacterium]|nr:polyphosphate kinase 2 [Gammaproteobacteria bacterium]
MTRSLKRKDYEPLLEPLQLELVAMARWLQHSGMRVVVLFEGRDTAGKGGAIDAIREHINPRQCRVVALPKPSERESAQWYFQRYVPHLPAAGEIALFDRSWYNRAGVEQVMGFARAAQVKAFLQQAPAFEQLLVDDGILLFKYWLCTDQAEQEKRFAERRGDPLKRWKLSPIDLEARKRYADYTRAREAMLKLTHTKHAPWTLVDFNDQKRGRLTLIRDLLDRLPDTHVPQTRVELAPLPGRASKERYGVLEPIADFPLDD